jgi:hypothetical protein
MFHNYWLIIPLTLTMSVSLSDVDAATLEPDYLAGNWEINTEGACGGKDAEHLILRSNHTFELGRRGKSEAVGFWRIEDDVVVFEVMSRPATFKDIHAELESYEGYDLYRMQMMPLDQQQERFSAVASMGDLMERLDFRRCR